MGGWSPAASSAGFDHEDVTGADGQADFLGFDGAGSAAFGVERVAMRLAVLAAENTDGAVDDAVAGK